METTDGPSLAAPGRTGRAAPRPAGRRAIAKAEKRARILAAARQLIGEKGYAQMSMSEVASHADVAAGTVFQYAATKAELLMMVTESIWAEHVDHILSTVSPPEHRSPAAVVDAIMESLDPVFEKAVHWPETTVWIAREILFGEDLPHRREVLMLVEKLEAHIARMLGGCRPTGPSTHTGHLDVGARMIVTSGLAELNRARQGRAEMHLVLQRMREIVALVAAGVGTPGTAGPDDAGPAPSASVSPASAGRAEHDGR